jgi:hypothetical protein
LQHNADAALYGVKQSSRNAFSVFGDTAAGA